MKLILKKWLRKLPFKRRKALTPGVAIFGINIFYEANPSKPQSEYALDYAMALKPPSVLDVGSGGGEHARKFAANGSQVECIDFGTSVYAANAQKLHDNIHVVHTDFNTFIPTKTYDLVWASHVLEHQRNVGLFIEQLIRCCATNGVVVITVPDMHRIMCGGHLSIWSPGLLAYNIVMCGVDLSKSRLIRGSHEFSISFQPTRMAIPELTYDFGDLKLLKPFLPDVFQEGGDSWLHW